MSDIIDKQTENGVLFRERTAKVQNQHMEYSLDGICFFEYGTCDNCWSQVQRGDKYCSECGCRLEWE